WTRLELDEETIIALSADHATSAQFHSEFKTDLDGERLPSGKFATNALVLACAMLAYNILRWIGQTGLLGPDAPPRAPAKRRRLRTVMQELMYVAARLIATGRRLKLAFGYGCPIVPVFRRLYGQLPAP
ncbi:transposase, partial [uncultured Thiodictyon sp.]|uniref:transposase n=1 Tax=uncultured Thiodictyon sp. TaxID=1846217 RepID=UPI0025DC583D